MYNEEKHELIDKFKYLGLVINFNDPFKLAITDTELKTRSLEPNMLNGKCRKLCLPVCRPTA